MNKFKAYSKRLLKNTKGQGMVEYMLILVVVAAIVFAAKEPILNYVKGDMMEGVRNAVGGVMNN